MFHVHVLVISFNVSRGPERMPSGQNFLIDHLYDFSVLILIVHLLRTIICMYLFSYYGLCEVLHINRKFTTYNP